MDYFFVFIVLLIISIILNIIVPDIITGVKQQLGYIKYINNPLTPIDRPFSDSVKGSKMPRAISDLWYF